MLLRKRLDVLVLLALAAFYVQQLPKVEGNQIQARSCGIPQKPFEELIIRGRNARRGEWPWHAALYHKKKKYVCGGTLISESYVVTAAHCLYDDTSQQFVGWSGILVRLGVYQLERALSDTAVQTRSVDRIFQGPEFNINLLINDITLLHLKEPVRFTNYVYPACVNRRGLVGANGTTIGWGRTEESELATTLKMATMSVIDDIDCLGSDRAHFGPMLNQGMLCAGQRNGTTVCNGDSGGGLFFNRNGVWFLGGIISFKKPRPSDNICATDGYAGFTNVAKYLSWMTNKTYIDFATDDYITLSSKSKNKRPLVFNYRSKADEKCAEYQQKKRETTSVEMSVVEIYDGEHRTCLGNIISPRFLLSTDRCIHRRIEEARLSARFPTENLIVPRVDPIFPPNYPSLGFAKSPVMLIDLRKDYDQLLPSISCLWTDTNEITLESLAGLRFPTKKDNRIRTKLTLTESDDETQMVTSSQFPCDYNSIVLGVRLEAKKLGESFYRMVGPLVNCENSRYARLDPFLDWITLVVWPEINQLEYVAQYIQNNKEPLEEAFERLKGPGKELTTYFENSKKDVDILGDALRYYGQNPGSVHRGLTELSNVINQNKEAIIDFLQNVFGRNR
ncbi:ovochymase-1-like [Uranotaenia lowii]|uniref:ovochymase-1-like n=1 Tax=Uranotaenia lowii TaxID=190385 RepID=UPI00247861CC|nr:ovochymase-1-like [Uranotaenia lowii]